VTSISGQVVLHRDVHVHVQKRKPTGKYSFIAAMELNAPDARRQWLSVLAKTPVAELEVAWHGSAGGVEFQYLRPSETGLCLVRARAGGTGLRFNLGEMTISRCAVRLATGEFGFGYVVGRSMRHAELVALFDAMLQRPNAMVPSLNGLIERLEQALVRRRREAAAKVAPSRVEFLTMVRGED
jgi:alpha-D-ribose 1-methylphosphonate 5-triphosphate synthase subunit PhnG